MNSSKVAIVVSEIIEKVEMIVGICGAVFFGICLLALISEGPGAVITMLILVLIGVWLFLCGRRRKKMRLEFRKYVAQLSEDPTGSLENMAGAMDKSIDVVKKELQFMIKKRFFTDAYIDEKNGRLVLPSLTQKMQQSQTASTAAGGRHRF